MCLFASRADGILTDPKVSVTFRQIDNQDLDRNRNTVRRGAPQDILDPANND